MVWWQQKHRTCCVTGVTDNFVLLQFAMCGFMTLDNPRATVNSNGSKTRGLSDIFAISANGVKIPVHLIFPMRFWRVKSGLKVFQMICCGLKLKTASGGTLSKVFLAYILWLVVFLNVANDPILHILVIDNLGALVTAVSTCGHAPHTPSLSSL